jgi:murein DD-endopeptidase MepM/ murein hydrolase activator NlpD
MKRIIWLLSATSFILLAFLSGVLLERKGNIAALKPYLATDEKEPEIRYGINISKFDVLKSKVEKNEAFSDILTKNNVAYESAKYLIHKTGDIFNANKIKAGNKYTVLGHQTDSGFIAKKIIYEESKIDYVVFNVDDSLYIHRGQHEVERRHREVAGIIRGSLYETFKILDINPALAVKLADVFSCTIDFYKIQEGDKFKIIFDEDFVGETSIGAGQISSAIFTSAGKEYHAFYYEKDPSHEGEYFDQYGASMKKQFLKAPVKFGHISSKFSKNRFHPVTKVWKAHLGTDYAAAHGTPIIATADGVIEDACYKAYNGNYVKIRHNGQYKTQYLHMSKIGKGIKRGRAVRQGEVIGYVGSTGLATGPHVCYRFWKDGQQVDPYKQSLKFSETLSGGQKNQFVRLISPLVAKMDSLDYDADPRIVLAEKKKAALEAKTLEFVAQYF